jgi:hypothetical protein
MFTEARIPAVDVYRSTYTDGRIPGRRHRRIPARPAQRALLVRFCLCKQKRYIKLVVIVNAGCAVDKIGFVYRLKGLRHRKPAGQALYRPCTDVGQKPGRTVNRHFCTSDAGDMQGFVHSRASKDGFCCVSRNILRQPVLSTWAGGIRERFVPLICSRAAHVAGSGFFGIRSEHRSFCRQIIACRAAAMPSAPCFSVYGLHE